MIQLVLIVLGMYWYLYTGINAFLSIALAVITLDAHVLVNQTQSQRDSLSVPSDKKIFKEDRIQGAPGISTPPMDILIIDVHRLAQLEYQRNVRISISEKNCRRQRGQNHVDEICKTHDFKLLQQLAKEGSQSMEEIPACTGHVPSFQTGETEVEVTLGLKHTKRLGSKSPESGVESRLSTFSAAFLTCRISGGWKPNSNNRALLSLDQRQISPPKISKVVPSLTWMDLVLPPNLFQPTSSPAIDLGLITPKIETPATCTDLILFRPEFVSSSSPTYANFDLRTQIISSTSAQLDLGLKHLVTPFRHLKPLLSSPSDAIKPSMVSPVTMPIILDLESGFPTPLFRRPKLLMPLSHSDVDTPAKSPSLISPPIDLSTSGLASNIMVNPILQAIREKTAKQIKIRGEKKARANKAAKALRNAWKRNSTYRRWVKVKKQAEKAVLIAGDKLHEIWREEERIWAKIEKMESKS